MIHAKEVKVGQVKNEPHILPSIVDLGEKNLISIYG